MLRILIADDERDARDNMISIIDWEKHGMKIVSAEDNGISAYESILNLQPDIVLIDIQMRGMNGLDVIAKVRDSDCLQPVFIIISGYDDFAYAQKAIRLKVDGYLQKPFRPEDVLSIIEEHFSDISISQGCHPKQSAVCQFPDASLPGHNTAVNYPVREEGMVINAILSGSDEEVQSALEAYDMALQVQKCSTSTVFNSYIILYAEICRRSRCQRPLRNLEALPWNRPDPVLSMHRLITNMALDLRHELEQTVREDSSPALRAKAYIESNYAQLLSLEIVANAVSVTPTYLSSCFSRDIGIGFVDYIKQIRVNHAKRMLEQSDLSVSEIAVACGYMDVKYFKQVFKHLTGLSPFSYRRQIISRGD